MVEKIQKRLPLLFRLAELESSRAGHIGMEVGSVREKIIVALLIYKFGESNIETQISITEREVDVLVFGKPVSIKTITGRLAGVKLIWTVDAEKAKNFYESYRPTCDMLLVQIIWNGKGRFCYIPLTVQHRHFDQMGRRSYIRLPKIGTNPRGVEMTREALSHLVEDSDSKVITIHWQKTDTRLDPYKRWVDLWRED